MFSRAIFGVTFKGPGTPEKYMLTGFIVKQGKNAGEIGHLLATSYTGINFDGLQEAWFSNHWESRHLLPCNCWELQKVPG